MADETTFEVVDISTVTMRDLTDLLEIGLDGIGYWANVRRLEWDNDRLISLEIREDDQESAEKPGWHKVSAMDMLRILPKIRSNSNQAKDWNVNEIVENADAEIGDIAIQLAIFEGVIYG